MTIVAGMAERHWVRIHSHRDPTESPQEAEERLTAGIYGVIVSSAVMTAAHVDSVGRLAFFVLVTLSIYWGQGLSLWGRSSRFRSRSRPPASLLAWATRCSTETAASGWPSTAAQAPTGSA